MMPFICDLGMPGREGKEKESCPSYMWQDWLVIAIAVVQCHEQEWKVNYGSRRVKAGHLGLSGSLHKQVQRPAARLLPSAT
jgi:hypothetical protein